MEALKLPVSDLKEFGVMDENNTFSKRLSEGDINNFLNGATIVCDNETKRITFRLHENNTRLEVNMYEIDKNISQIRNESKLEIVYANVRDISKGDNDINYKKNAYILDNKNIQSVTEYDFIKNSKNLTKAVLETNDEIQVKRYKQELLKFKGFLQEKMDKYPLIAKYVERDLNIISKAIIAVDNISLTTKSIKQHENSIKPSVSDSDSYGKKSDNKENIKSEKEEIRSVFRR